MSYEDFPLWKWCASGAKFIARHAVSSPDIGKYPVSQFPPIWEIELDLPVQNFAARNEIEALLLGGEGVQPIRVYDPLIPVPQRFASVKHNMSLEDLVPNLTVSSVSIEDSAITVSGETGDIITVGDPIAFTHAGRRHYYKALETISLTSGSNILKVGFRPRTELTGQSITAERIKPALAFSVDYNPILGMTDVAQNTPVKLSGIEYTGEL